MNKAELVEAAREYMAGHVAPPELLHAGIHGSIVDQPAEQLLSDCDFYFICQKPSQRLLLGFISPMVESFNRQTLCWVDPMVGCVDGREPFAFNPFTIGTIENKRIEVYGSGINETLAQMNANHQGESQEEYLMREVTMAGVKIKRGLVSINAMQPMHTSSIFPLDWINIREPEHLKASFVAKNILAGGSFACVLERRLRGEREPFSKRHAPERLSEIFGICSEIPGEARAIYYEGRKHGLDAFLGKVAEHWFGTQYWLESQLGPEVLRIQHDRVSAKLAIEAS